MAESDVPNARQTTLKLVVVCGLPGVGKTTVAETVADRVDGRLLRTDVVRKEIFSDPEYTEEEARIVYRELFERARETIEGGRSVVLDGTFKDAHLRDQAGDLAASLDATFRLVKVEADEEVVRERITAREDDASDADFEIHALFREQFDPVSRTHVTVDNSADLDSTTRRVDEQF